MLLFIPLFIPLSKGVANTVITSETEDDTQVANINMLSEQAIFAPRSKTDFIRQCYSNVPPNVPNTNTQPDNEIPVNIEALSISGKNNRIIYQDDVHLIKGDKYLVADKMTYFIDEERALAEGNANYIDGGVTLYSDNMETNLKNDQNTLYQTNYQFHGTGGRGNADKMYDNGLNLYELSTSTYTACPPEDTTWKLDATTLYIDKNEEVGSAYNAVLSIKNVPIFYFPYFSYPLTDKRKTGLLFPSFKWSDTNGMTYSQSLYINLAPNMDATLTPTYMPHRGTKIAGEYRYLLDAGTGNIQAEYLADDKIRGFDRYLYHWDHNVNFAQNWNFNAKYNKVSDDNYFNDLDTKYGDRSDNTLLKTANLSYTEENWKSELEVRSFQVLGGDSPHTVMPKLSFDAYKPLNWKSLQFDLYSEVTKFDHTDENVYTGSRIHIEPKLSLPLYYDSMFVNTELKYMLSFYNQDIPDEKKYEWYNDLQSSVNRYIPSFKIHSGVNFERDLSFMGSNYRQTLVPQMQYLYVPYQDQSGIGLYDTATLQQDYYGLFRNNRYSGYDRIADANQFTLGVSSSFLNSQGQERMRFALGQNYYLTPSKIYLPQYSNQDVIETRSSLIAQFDMNFENSYFLHSGIEWDTGNNLIKRANTTIEKRWLYNTFTQINYRYIALPKEGGSPEELAKGLVNQLGGKMNWSINNQWTAFASVYHNLKYDLPFENIIGIKYQSCCWAIGFTYDSHMNAYYGDLNDINNEVKTEQSLNINFELMGLGGVGFSSGGKGIFNYGRPFYLQ